MAGATVTVSGIHREVIQIAETVNGIYREVTEIPATVNGVYREGYAAYTPPTYSDALIGSSSSQEWITNNPIVNFGNKIMMTDFVAALNYGYTKFCATILAHSQFATTNVVRIGFCSSAEADPTVAISTPEQIHPHAYAEAGYLPSSVYNPATEQYTTTIDVASVIAQLTSSGWIQPAARGYDENDSGAWGYGSITDIHFEK